MDEDDPQLPPWKRPSPKGKKREGTKLTEESIALAKARAKAAGRRYPNLVDNMWAASLQKGEPD